MRDRFTPAPEPPLKMIPSSRYQLRMESIESSTDKMKQADAWRGDPGTPMLNQTGELKAMRWCTSNQVSSAANASRSASSAKYPSDAPQPEMVDTTRSIT